MKEIIKCILSAGLGVNAFTLIAIAFTLHNPWFAVAAFVSAISAFYLMPKEEAFDE